MFDVYHVILLWMFADLAADQGYAAIRIPKLYAARWVLVNIETQFLESCGAPGQ
jgi:hypothetical protein